MKNKKFQKPEILDKIVKLFIYTNIIFILINIWIFININIILGLQQLIDNKRSNSGRVHLDACSSWQSVYL